MNKWQGQGVHWSATGWKVTVADIRRGHVKGNGWRDIGYHRVILHPFLYQSLGYSLRDLEPGKLIKLGRNLDDDLIVEWNEIPAAARGHNKGWLHTCLIAGPSCEVHPMQLNALQIVVETFNERYKLDPSKVYGHNEFAGHESNQCPGPEISNWIKDYRKGLLNG